MTSPGANYFDDETVILLVVMPELNKAQEKYLERRFHIFWSKEYGHVEYPCTNDSHAFDVFEDEFGPGTIFDGKIPHAAINVLPFGPDHFVPFSEYSEGYQIAERNEEGTAWVLEPWAQQAYS